MGNIIIFIDRGSLSASDGALFWQQGMKGQANVDALSGLGDRATKRKREKAENWTDELKREEGGNRSF